MSERAIIVGGGVSGLATAYFLGRLGVPCILFEKSTRLGGLIKTDLIQGCQLETGPDSYLAAKPSVAELANELGELGRQIIPSNDKARKVFIGRRGRLIPMPSGMVFMTPGAMGPALRSPLFTMKSKLRFLVERSASPRQRTEDVSVGQLVGEHFGREVLEYVAEPLLSGVYGGDAARLSAESVLPRFLDYERRYGSLIKGVQEERRAAPEGGLFRSFAGGMQSLTDTLAAGISSHTRIVSAEVRNVSEAGNGWRAETSAGSFEAQDVILACPAHAAARLLRPAVPAAAQELAAIPYSSAILVTMVFDHAALGRSLNGFGFLIPRRERRTIAAATWINTKFPARIPPGLAAIRAFIVGDEAIRLLGNSEAELIELVRQDLIRWMSTSAEPLFTTVYKWPNSMPQYVVGHRKRQERITEALKARPRLHLVGNAYEGVGIPDCIRLAKNVAHAVKAGRTG